MKEEWRDIKNYVRLYQVSNFGRVKSFYYGKERILTGHPDRGYLRLELSKNGIKIHRSIHQLVTEAFIPNPLNKPTVNHKDGNKLNNFVWNLEWATHKEQMEHAELNNLTNYCKGENVGTSKLKPDQVLEIRRKYATGKYSLRQLGDEYNVILNTIWKIVNRITWKHI
jgi:hypothetical protein